MRRRWLAAMSLMLALSACNITESALEAGPQPPTTVGDPAALTPQEDLGGATREPGETPATIASAGAAAPAGTLGAQAAGLSSSARIRFAPIVGATVEAATPLMRALSERAAQRGIALTSSGANPGATHLMKGYFSAISDNGETTVIYVWDVVDPSGGRLHRIQGHEKAETTAAQGWPGVTDRMMQTIGHATIDQLAAWLAAGQG